MKGKRRGRVNPLAEYRRLQRRIRQIFDPFTAKHCAACVTPCCVKPTRVTPFDVALAVGAGHSFPHLEGRDPYDPALRDASVRLGPESMIPLPMASPIPDCPPSDRSTAHCPPAELSLPDHCDFLHHGRCTFPDDLRPHGCTTYLCGPMYANLPDETIRRLRRLVRELELVRADVVAAIGRSS